MVVAEALVSSLVKSRCVYFETRNDKQPLREVASVVETPANSYVRRLKAKFDGSSLMTGESTMESTMKESTVEDTVEAPAKKKRTTVREVLKVIRQEMNLTSDQFKDLPGGETAIYWGHLDRMCDTATFEALFMVLFDVELVENSFLEKQPVISDMLVNIIIKSGYSGKILPGLFMMHRLEATDPKVIKGWEYMMRRIPRQRIRLPRGVALCEGRLATIAE
jgi:hypothetical protein